MERLMESLRKLWEKVPEKVENIPPYKADERKQEHPIRVKHKDHMAYVMEATARTRKILEKEAKNFQKNDFIKALESKQFAKREVNEYSEHVDFVPASIKSIIGRIAEKQKWKEW